MTKRKCRGNPNGRPAQKHDLSPLDGIRALPRYGKFAQRFKTEDAARIREFIVSQGRPRGLLSQIAKRFKVTPATVWWIVEGRAHK